MILVKLGGSIITNKKKPLSPRISYINKIARHLRKIKEPAIITHGGGSFGHYWSVKYDMHTRPSKYDIHGVSVVKNSMIELNSIVSGCLARAGLHPYSIPPSAFMVSERAEPAMVRQLAKIARAGFTPITYGDALWHSDKKSFILSGDRIMSILAKILRPRLCIFVLDVDGIYTSMKSKELVYEITGQNAQIDQTPMDVTGGMKRKIQEATKISKMGIDVFFVNGTRPERIVKAVQKAKFEGTLFRGI